MDIEQHVESSVQDLFKLRKFSLTLQNQFVCVLPALDGSVIIVQEFINASTQYQVINHVDKKGKKLAEIKYLQSSGQYCIIDDTKIVRLGIPYSKISDFNEKIEIDPLKQSKYFQISLTDWNLLTHAQDNFTLKEPVQENNLRSIMLYSFPLTGIVAYMLEYYQPEKSKLQFRFKTYKTPIAQDKGYSFKPLIYKLPKHKIKIAGNHQYRCMKVNDRQKMVIFPFLQYIESENFEFVTLDLINQQIKQYKFQFPEDFPTNFTPQQKKKLRNKGDINKTCFQSDIWEVEESVFYLRFQTTQSKLNGRKSWTYFWNSKIGDIFSPGDQPTNISYHAVFTNSLRMNQYYYEKSNNYLISPSTYKISQIDIPEKKVQKYNTYRNKKIYPEYHPRVLIANLKKKWLLKSSMYELLQLPYPHAYYIAFMLDQMEPKWDSDLIKKIVGLSRLDQYKGVFKTQQVEQ